jgi:hypothetical protein
MSFLPGHFPGGAAAAAGSLTTLTFVASSTANNTVGGTSDALVAPADIVAGDLLIFMDRSNSDNSPNAPSGFTNINQLGASFQWTAVSYKLAVGTEASTQILGLFEYYAHPQIMLVFRGNVPIKTITVADVESERTNNNPSSKTVNASGGAPPLIVFGCYGSTQIVNPRTMSPAKDGEVENQPEGGSTTAFANIAIAWKIYNTSPADVSVDMDDESNENTLQTFYIECA